MEHVGIVVDDLAAATEFFVELRLAARRASSSSWRRRSANASSRVAR
jgi:hypothetical protein